MRAILPGRPQSKRQALCTAHWDGLRLVAYVSGNTVIVLSGPRNIIQTILVDNAKTLIAITIEETSGRIAVCDERHVQIYDALGREEDDLRWTHAHEITVESEATAACLSWGSEQELLVGGSQLYLYHLPAGGDTRLIWQQHVANRISAAHFSNDSELIASYGQHDRVVKIWRRLSHELDNIRFDVSYLPHPATVTNLHWRKPWHAEQALDNLLYTICADGQVRLWTYSDPHSLSVMQLIATVDTNASIQPRRLSVGSVSRRRYVFILDSRDFSQATEKALQQSRSTTVDHALEHLVEVANRSPEICVVLDGLGHMSAWGLENAGCKSRKPTVVFNVALVDDVRMQLNFAHDPETDYIQFCCFAGSTTPATLSLLVHSFTGQIDWYESPISEFFDTATRQQRLQLVSSWSGHDLPIDHIAHANKGGNIFSWTDKGQGILWSQTSNGALQLKATLTLGDDVLGVIVLDDKSLIISLHPKQLILWDTSNKHIPQMATAALNSNSQPNSIRLQAIEQEHSDKQTFVVGFGKSFQVWQVRLLTSSNATPKMNGNYKPLMNTGKFDVDGRASQIRSIALDNSTANPWISHRYSLCTVDDGGCIRAFKEEQSATNNFRLLQTLRSCILRPLHIRATRNGLVAMTDFAGKTLTIWNLDQKTYEWKHEFPGPDHIQKMAWTSTSNGHMLLFVSFSFHALVIGQARYTERDGRFCWHILQDISLRDFTTNFIGDISWLSSTDLAIGAGNQLFVLSSQCNRGETGTMANPGKPGTTTPASHYVDSANATLPIFHPAVLRHILMEGHFDQVIRILLALYEKLKFFADGDELDSFLDQMPSCWLHDQLMIDEGAQLNNIAITLVEYIEKAELWQLCAKDKQDLASFVSVYVEIEKHRKSLDLNGLRYLFALYSTPRDEELSWKSFVFASQSTSQEALLDLVSRHHKSKITWDVARRTGLFVWLEDRIALQTQFENVARSEYTKHEDRNPVDCSLYYLALNKKSVLQGLWRMTIGVREKENTMKLLANNFDDPRWQSTALKNAYALLSKRRFDYGAAFFLLGSSLKDAVNVCVNQLNDIQLAIAVCRVWDKNITQSEEVLRQLLKTHVLPCAVDEEQGRWMACMAYHMLDEPEQAIKAIVRPLDKVVGVDKQHHEFEIPLRSASYHASDPHLYLAYCQIRSVLERKGKWTSDVLESSEEMEFVRLKANWLARAGLDLCGVQLLRDWKFVDFKVPKSTTLTVAMKSDTASVPTSTTNMNGYQTQSQAATKKPPPTQFIEPSTDSLLDSFGF